MSKKVDEELSEALRKQISDYKPPAVSQELQKVARAQIQRELAAVQAVQSRYERYCEEERAADRMPRDFDEWQRKEHKSYFA